MPLVVRQLLDGRPTAKDFHSKGVASLRYGVDTSNSVSARAAVEALHGGVNTPHPEDPSLLVDSIATELADSRVETVVTYNYSSDRRASLPPRVNKDRLNYFGFRMGASAVEVPFPYAVREKATLGIANGSQSKLLWTLKNDRHYLEPRGKLWINVSVSGWDMNKTGLVMAQVSKVHTINGKDYLFISGNVNQRTDSVAALYDVTYEWQYDPGTKGNTTNNETLTGLSFPVIDRPPYYEYIARTHPTNAPDTAIGYPEYTTHPRYEKIALGWQSLPGMPSL